MSERSTSGYLPMMKCPNCRRAWQWDDYYEVKAGTERDCPYCEAEIVVTSAEQLIHAILDVKSPVSEP